MRTLQDMDIDPATVQVRRSRTRARSVRQCNDHQGAKPRENRQAPKMCLLLIDAVKYNHGRVSVLSLVRIIRPALPQNERPRVRWATQ